MRGRVLAAIRNISTKCNHSTIIAPAVLTNKHGLVDVGSKLVMALNSVLYGKCMCHYVTLPSSINKHMTPCTKPYIEIHTLCKQEQEKSISLLENCNIERTR